MNSVCPTGLWFSALAHSHANLPVSAGRQLSVVEWSGVEWGGVGWGGVEWSGVLDGTDEKVCVCELIKAGVTEL